VLLPMSVSLSLSLSLSLVVSQYIRDPHLQRLCQCQGKEEQTAPPRIEKEVEEVVVVLVTMVVEAVASDPIRNITVTVTATATPLMITTMTTKVRA
jgi:hypothetical protein